MTTTAERDAWKEIRTQLMTLGAEFVNVAITERTLVEIAGRATHILRDVAYAHGLWATIGKWSIHVWRPERIPITKTVQLIAVDPDGIGHDIDALTKGDVHITNAPPMTDERIVESTPLPKPSIRTAPRASADDASALLRDAVVLLTRVERGEADSNAMCGEVFLWLQRAERFGVR